MLLGVRSVPKEERASASHPQELGCGRSKFVIYAKGHVARLARRKKAETHKHNCVTQAFIRHGCGICDQIKRKRPAFKSVTDKTIPP
eukprot:3162746-Prymnesium_polylepis.1